MRGRFAGWWVGHGILNMKRPGRNRALSCEVTRPSLGLRLVIRHGGHFFLCFGFAIRRLPGLLRAFGRKMAGIQPVPAPGSASLAMPFFN